MNLVQFSAKIQIIGINPYVKVPKELAESIKSAWRRPMPVLAQVNGHPKDPWPINMMPIGNGDFYLYLHADVRKASNTKVGDAVTIQISFNENYKGGPADLPDWLLAILETDEVIHENWTDLPPSRQKEVVRYLTNLKSEEARQRNLRKLKEVLSGSSGHYMGRDWKNGK